MLTMVHMFCCSVFAFVTLRAGLIPLAKMPESSHRRYAAVSLLFVVNILLGTWSLQYIPVSFMQAIKSAVPAVTVLMQRYMFAERFDRMIYISLVPVVGGVALASLTEVNFHPYGFILALISCFTTALQTCLFARYLQQKLDSVNLIYELAPLACLELGFMFYHTEAYHFQLFWQSQGSETLVVWLFISGLFAFLLNWSTFLAIQSTSALTFNVSGNLKAIINIVISSMIFQNEISFWNGFGCFIALVGVFWYSLLRAAAPVSTPTAVPLLLSSSSSSTSGGGL
jgi:solute carrier family 35, member E3